LNLILHLRGSAPRYARGSWTLLEEGICSTIQEKPKKKKPKKRKAKESIDTREPQKM
jgi:hypothetical protein